jgi:hypothetical protein
MDRTAAEAFRALVLAGCAYQRYATTPAVRTAAAGVSATHEQRVNRPWTSPVVRRGERMAAIGPSRVGVANI